MRSPASGPSPASTTPTTTSLARRRLGLALAAVVTVAAGLAVRLGLRGVPGTAWWTGPVGDVLYAVLIYLLAAFCAPRVRTAALAAAAFGICAAIELFQLTGIPADLGQAFPPARLVLGTGFLWSDLLLYLVGVGAAAAVDAAVRLSPRGSGPRGRSGP